MKQLRLNAGGLALVALWLAVPTVSACPACLGKVDSAMVDGYNWAILSLMFVITSVLAGVASFFVYLARRAARLPAPEISRIPPPTSNKV